MLTLLFSTLLMSADAQAGNCDYLVAKAKTSKGSALAKTYGELARCDHSLAEENFGTFLRGAGDADTLVELSLTAIDWEIWPEVGKMLGKITSYDARDEVANRVGGSCGERDKVVQFLKYAYFGLKDIEFAQWDDAFMACDSPVLFDWMKEQVASPPDKVFDEKYNTLVGIYAQRAGAEGLPVLSKAAIAAAAEGPYDSILAQMDAAIAPALGEDVTPENKKALEDALVTVAKEVGPEKARAVADRLANSGSDAAAASLLPVIFADRMQGGNFVYGAVSVETADCKGTKTAVLHVAQVLEPGTRWVILGDIEEPMRAFKPKLAKCEAEGDWGVSTTAEPISSSKDTDAVIAELTGIWQGKGYEVSTKAEKDIQLK